MSQQSYGNTVAESFVLGYIGVQFQER